MSNAKEERARHTYLPAVSVESLIGDGITRTYPKTASPVFIFIFSARYGSTN